MPDLLNKSLSVHGAAIICVYWIMAFAIPFMIVDPEVRPGPWGWCLFAALIGYGGYSGFRAYRRGWKARFILRIVIPAALFVTASVIIAAFKWF
ncbi:MAG: hypothetical protein ABW106_12465 [Steroidobacteraceae bacterium]